jgi:thiosulfate/3-mercaptopyruvate sulfurtransferase
VSASPLIDVATLASRLDDPQLLIVDCRFDLAQPAWGESEYALAHLPGAVYAHLDRDLSSSRSDSSGRHPLPDVAAFAGLLSGWGVAEHTQIVAYDQNNGAFASRLWWLLRASGHGAVSVLDGGYAAWIKAALPLQQTITPRPAHARSVADFQDWLSAADVEQALARDQILLVDARSAERYAGRVEPIDPVAGHVPGAVNHALTDNLAADARFLSAAELRQRWLKTLGGRSAGELVSMCGSGITACHNLLALEIAGLHGARLYAGSWSEWIRDPRRAIASAEPQDLGVMNSAEVQMRD